MEANSHNPDIGSPAETLGDGNKYIEAPKSRDAKPPNLQTLNPIPKPL